MPDHVADAISMAARNFYERTRFSVFLSLIYGAIGLTFLGFCAESGGYAASSRERAELTSADISASKTETGTYKSYTILSQGYGFSASLYFFAFVIMISAAVYTSPYFNGTPKERHSLSKPSESGSSRWP